MMEHTFTQTITHQKGPAWGVDAIDEYSQPKVVTPTSIKARVEVKFSRVIGQMGQEHQSQFQVFTAADVRVGDVLGINGQDHVVLASATNQDLAGRDQFRTVMC